MNWFNNLKIRIKLISLSALLIFFTVIIGFFGVHNARSLDHLITHMYEKELLGTSYVKEVDIALTQVALAEKNYLELQH